MEMIKNGHITIIGVEALSEDADKQTEDTFYSTVTDKFLKNFPT